MKKKLFLFSVLCAILTGALAQTVAAHLSKPLAKVEINNLTKDLLNEPAPLAESNAHRINGLRKVNAPAQQGNVEEVVVDLWGSVGEIMAFSENTSYDPETNTITFPGNVATNIFLSGVNDGAYYAWVSSKEQTYHFSGKLSSDGYAVVDPCIVYQRGDQFYIMNSTQVVLDETNGYSADFNISAFNSTSQDEVLFVVFVIEEGVAGTITSTENSLSYSYQTIIAQKWSEESDLPGLGIANNVDPEQAYTILCEDGVTTLGLYYDGDLSVTGINTTASEVALPHNIITLDGNATTISHFGYNEMDWSGAPNLSQLDIRPAREVRASFSNSNVTDLYIGEGCSINNDYSGNSNVYLHIPYGSNRYDYDWQEFKRVLVGDEQPEYPTSTNSDWVIAGENEGDYFGIVLRDNVYRIGEIFTTKDSISLPIGTPAAGGMYYIRGIGNDSNHGSGTLCRNAPNLKSITIPNSYNSVNIYWSSNPIIELHMQGDVPSTNWSLPSSLSVYVTESYYSNYINNSAWSSANILPDGWDFEWMVVNVTRKGEFAQTYIEMTDADWSLAKNVKVTGALNATDLGNIKNLTSLMKLDLREAEFTELPASFLYNKTSVTEVVFPESLTAISTYAFYYCSNLRKVIAPGVKAVGSQAFYNCIKLVEFDIQDVTEIKSSAFYHCSLFTPTQLSPELSILESDSFSYSGITEFTIPNGISTISSSLFSHCQHLQKVTLPNTVTTISSDAFYGCTSLTDINLPNGLTEIGSSAFRDCTHLIDINLPEGMTEIGYRAFYGCSSIGNITLPSTLQSIGSGIFNNCTTLTAVKCKAIVPPVTNGEFTSGIDLNHCTLYIAPFTIDAYRAAQDWNRFYIMKPLDEPVKNIYINRPMSFDLLSEDNAVLQENPNMTLDYTASGSTSVGQLSASGDGTLSAGLFSIHHYFYRRTNSSDRRTTLVNKAENMRADSVMCTITFEKNCWHFISFQYDVEMEDILALNNTDFVIRQYNSINRASGDELASTWENVPADGTLEAGKGYIIQVANNSTDENGYTQKATVCFPSRNVVTKNRLFTSNNVIVPLEEYPAEFAHNRSWNLVGNPYPCYYDMHYLMDDFTAPIVLWKGTTYQAYSPVDDDIILRPNEAFFIQRPLDVEQMVFGTEGRMHYDDAYNANTTPGIYGAPAKVNSERSVFNFTIDGLGCNDRTRIVMNEKASMDYEISCDASKFFAEVSEGAEIYVNSGVKYDICERPFADGTAVLGTRIAQEGVYTLTLTGRSIDGWNVILKDTETGAVVDLTEQSYSFNAKTGTLQSRFALTFNAPGESSIENIVASENGNVRIVNTAGITVYEGKLDEFKTQAQAGVYIVVGAEKAYKVVIK